MNAPHNDAPRRLDLKDPSLFTDKAYVAGEWISAPDGKTMTISDPFDGSLLARVPDLGVDTLRRAIDAAHDAQKLWAKKTVKERAQVLRRWYDLVIANADDLALILTSEQGKPLAEAKGEIVANAAYLEWFAEEAKRIDGDMIPSPRGDQRILVLKQPVGVVRRHHAVEFSRWHDHPQSRARAGGRLHHGAEARAADAAFGAGAGGTGRAGRRARGLFLGGHRRGQADR